MTLIRVRDASRTPQICQAVSMSSFSDTVSFAHGPSMPNRFMLAPLTNMQSHADGTLSDAEHHWLTMRATGGFGLTMTCAAHVQRVGQGFPGQLGTFSDDHVPGLKRLASDIRATGSVAIVQLHHAGNRSPKDVIGTDPVCPSDDPSTGARALSTMEVEQLVTDFVRAAERCDEAGFDGIELHGAHGYMICQFLSSEINQRSDRYGGSLENRSRVLLDIIDGIRRKCRPDFHVGVRLSPERFGMVLDEIRELYGWLVDGAKVDMIDMSLWDCFAHAKDSNHADRRLIDVFAELPRGGVKVAVAGKLYAGSDVVRAIDAGADIVALGRAAILHHDFPRMMAKDPSVSMRSLPVTADELRAEGLSDGFVGYMRSWPGFVAE